MKSSMKGIYLISLLVQIVIIGCHSKTVPVITSRENDPLPPVSIVNEPPNLETGKVIFAAKCQRCHDLPDPLKYNAQRWDAILRTMIPKARLSSQEANNLT